MLLNCDVISNALTLNAHNSWLSCAFIVVFIMYNPEVAFEAWL